VTAIESNTVEATPQTTEYLFTLKMLTLRALPT